MWSRMKPWCSLKPGFCSQCQIKTIIGRLLLLCVIIAGCMNTEYRFERVDGEQPVALGLKFDSMYGVRDGESVRAEARFTGGHDSAKVNIALNLGPPVQFTSGTYVAIIGGRSTEGTVACESLTFLGGQASVPSVGGVFVLKDDGGRTAYRVTMPPTPIKRRLGS